MPVNIIYLDADDHFVTPACSFVFITELSIIYCSSAVLQCRFFMAKKGPKMALKCTKKLLETPHAFWMGGGGGVAKALAVKAYYKEGLFCNPPLIEK